MIDAFHVIRNNFIIIILYYSLWFSEPFDTASWMLVGIVAIHAATIMILLFEWLSPSGFNMKVNPSDAAQKPVLLISLLISYVCFLAFRARNPYRANYYTGQYH